MILTKDSNIKISDKKLRIAIYNAFDGKCFYTGRSISFEEMHIDHINPKSKGGKDCISNYVLSCGYINLKKFDTVSYNLIKISKEVVNSFFVNKVIFHYNELSLNEGIFNDYIEINYFLKKYLKDASHKERFRNYVRLHLKALKIYKKYINGRKVITATKPSLFYNKIEIKKLYNGYI